MSNLACLNDLFGPAKTCKQRVDYTVPKGIILLVPGTTFTNEADLATEATHNTKIVAGSEFPFQDIVEIEGQDGDNIFQETSYQERMKLLNGKNSAKLMLRMPLDQHQNSYKYFNGRNWEAIIIDLFGNLIATKNSDGTIRGVTLSYFNIDRLNTATLENAVLTAIDYDITNVDEINVNGVYLNPSLLATGQWFPQKLDGVLKVQISSGSISVNVFTSTVKYVDVANPLGNGAEDSELMTGLAAGNFKVLTSAGATITPDSVVETPASSGAYVITCTTDTVSPGDTVQVIPTTADPIKSEVETLT